MHSFARCGGFYFFSRPPLPADEQLVNLLFPTWDARQRRATTIFDNLVVVTSGI